MTPEVVKAPVTRFGASGLAHQTRITVNCNWEKGADIILSAGYWLWEETSDGYSWYCVHTFFDKLKHWTFDVLMKEMSKHFRNIFSKNQRINGA